MEKIRKSLKSLNPAIVFIAIFLIGFVLIYFFHIDPTIALIICIAIVCLYQICVLYTLWTHLV